MDDGYWSRVSELRLFRESVAALTKISVTSSLPAISPEPVDEVQWNKALLTASLVSRDANEAAYDGALRIAQGCIQSETTTAEQKEGARALLERLGNSRAVALAIDKELIPRESLLASTTMELDSIRSNLALAIPLSSGDLLPANQFQNNFWNAASSSKWVSVSAPTSAGKSFIVKRWFEELLFERATFTGAYIVPTRALIEEVSRDLTAELSGKADVFSLPWDPRLTDSPKRVLVLTQERLHVLQQRQADFVLDVIFIDEAQKFGDGGRGVLLQRVLDEAVKRRESMQVLFASPAVSNPELLVEGGPAGSQSFSSGMVTVNQNLIYADQVRGYPLRWTAKVVVKGEAVLAGTFTLPARPQPAGKRLGLVAVALGSTSAGNVVYANGPAEAEKVADLIWEALGDDHSVADDPDVEALRELVEKTIHPQYALRRLLLKGVAYHYGNMPLLLREEVERLFRDGKITYLVCTSTLLEGVNLPCQNLFVRAPRKGNSRPMSQADFWNLAGRAGRWGIEFQGNIICVDAEAPSVWEEAPLVRVKRPIHRATDALVTSYAEVLEYIQTGSPVQAGRANKLLEPLYSLLAAHFNRGIDIRSMNWFPLNERQAFALTEAVEVALAGVELPASVTSRHAGISPNAMQRLFAYMKNHPEPTDLRIPAPESRDAARMIVKALSRINTYLGGSVGDHQGRQMQLAILLVSWMRGMPLAVLIRERVDYRRLNTPNVGLATTIRDVMTDVEQFARFEAPLYLACYSDILVSANVSQGRADLSEGTPDIAMMLELGVSRTTELSAMSLGLSRMSAVALSDYIVADELDPVAFLSWVKNRDLESLDIPGLVRNEIQRLIALHETSHGEA